MTIEEAIKEIENAKEREGQYLEKIKELTEQGKTTDEALKKEQEKNNQLFDMLMSLGITKKKEEAKPNEDKLDYKDLKI